MQQRHLEPWVFVSALWRASGRSPLRNPVLLEPESIRLDEISVHLEPLENLWQRVAAEFLEVRLS